MGLTVKELGSTEASDPDAHNREYAPGIVYEIDGGDGMHIPRAVVKNAKGKNDTISWNSTTLEYDTTREK
ncbi:MAG TPA: hypothetical protein VL832_15280 [Puia sp.]|nr:hypothetical protein [Puia sp.]